MSKMRHPKLQLRDWWRVPRVFWHLLITPADIPRYLRQSLNTKLTPLDMGLPWWSFGAVDAVDQFVRPEMESFEFGSGGSTIFLARKGKSVVCVEDSELWTDRVRKEAEKQGLQNIELLSRPFDFRKAVRFSESSYLRALTDRSFDVIVVDGQEESVKVRPECFWRAEAHIKPGGLIVVDDSWRYSELKERNKAKRWEDYKGVGCCRRGVTSTCLFYY